MHNIYLFQPQYTSIFNGEKTYWIPYSIGCLWSYVKQFDHIDKNFECPELFFRRDHPADIIKRLDNPKLCGFSCYIWNEKYCLHVAEEIKKQWPECIIVFGGEQPDQSFLDYDFIDSLAQYEGEENFLEILECILDNKKIPKTFPKRRLHDLDIPSPYTEGIFDKIIKDNPNAKWNMTFETNRGCPFSCTFCNWGSLTQSKIKRFNLERVEKDLEWCIGKPITYLFAADANFGIFKERDLEIARVIKRVAALSEIDAVNLQYTKNSNETVFEIAKEMDHLSRGITVSVQSMNQPTLEAIKRTNLAFDNIDHVMSIAKKYKIKTYSEMILGLPLETIDSWKDGLCELLELGQHDSIDVWFAQLLQNSELAHPDTVKQYGIKSVVAQDYITLNNYNYWEDVPEQINIINATDTMTTEQMAECYIYAWMIINFHINGYSQIYSKYLNKVKKIPYRTFYDLLWQELNLPTNNQLQKHVKFLRDTIYKYLMTGEAIDDGQKGHNFLHVSSKFLYDNKSDMFEISKTILDCLCKDNPTNLQKLQENILLDKELSYPIQISFDYNIDGNWENKEVNITLNSRITDFDNHNFYALRRQNLIRNQIFVQ